MLNEDKAMKEKKQEIHVQGTGGLSSFTFEVLPLPKDADPNIHVVDSVSASNLSLKGFDLRFSRKISFEPAAIFEASVVFKANIFFEDDAGVKVLGSLDAVAAWVENNKVRIVNTFCYPCVASNMLSNASLSAGFKPIITQPTVIMAQQLQK